MVKSSAEVAAWLIIVVFLLFLGTQQCKADGIILGGWSQHTISGDWNQTHRVVGVEYNRYSVISFTNSYGEDAWGVGYTTPITLDGAPNKYGFSMYWALWFGYKELGVDVLPVASGRITYPLYHNVHADLYINPIAPAAALYWRF